MRLDNNNEKSVIEDLGGHVRSIIRCQIGIKEAWFTQHAALPSLRHKYARLTKVRIASLYAACFSLVQLFTKLRLASTISIAFCRKYSRI
jgi:hypothetical protein